MSAVAPAPSTASNAPKHLQPATQPVGVESMTIDRLSLWQSLSPFFEAQIFLSDPFFHSSLVFLAAGTSLVVLLQVVDFSAQNTAASSAYANFISVKPEPYHLWGFSFLAAVAYYLRQYQASKAQQCFIRPSTYHSDLGGFIIRPLPFGGSFFDTISVDVTLSNGHQMKIALFGQLLGGRKVYLQDGVTSARPANIREFKTKSPFWFHCSLEGDVCPPFILPSGYVCAEAFSETEVAVAAGSAGDEKDSKESLVKIAFNIHQKSGAQINYSNTVPMNLLKPYTTKYILMRTHFSLLSVFWSWLYFRIHKAWARGAPVSRRLLTGSMVGYIDVLHLMDFPSVEPPTGKDKSV